jgi:hypothetical protein
MPEPDAGSPLFALFSIARLALCGAAGLVAAAALCVCAAAAAATVFLAPLGAVVAAGAVMLCVVSTTAVVFAGFFAIFRAVAGCTEKQATI